MVSTKLQSLELKEVEALKTKAEARKAELGALKAKGGKDWTPDMQEELDDIVLFLVDADEVIEAKTKEQSSESEIYTPKKGTEKMVHISIVRGRRFNPNTGKEESKPYAQMFTFSEWQLFKKSFKNLGYVITDVLHDPYGDAKELISK